MFLQKIEIQGFKSFANKTVIQFDRINGSSDNHGIACIVGPNGSGKSNIVDALRWVLGEQSLKSLRGKKSEDVIFSGSDKKARLGMAEVSIFINNESGVVPIDYPEVVISRKLYRNGESEYLINKSKVRLQDVLLLLARANFGQKSYSIISQGSIDQVIMATPAERKDYFDEAVGVKQFQLKRDISINKLENAWNNLRQVDALLTEISPRLNSLTRQVKRLEKREAIEIELRQIAQQYFGHVWGELLKKINEVKPKLTQAEQAKSDKEKELSLLQQQLKEMEVADSASKVFGDLQKKYQEILEQKNKLREEQLLLKNKIEWAKQKIVERPVPMALDEILRRLGELEKFESRLLLLLQSTDLGKLAQAREDVAELGRTVRDLIDRLANPKTTERQRQEVDPAWIESLQSIEKNLELTSEQLVEAEQNMQQFNMRQEQEKGKFFDLQRNITARQDEYNKLAGVASELRVEIAKLETRQQDVREQIIEELSDDVWLKDFEAKKIDEQQTYDQMIKLRRQLELIGGVDPEVVSEYTETKERYDFLSTQADDLRKSIESLEKVINELDEQIQDQFDKSFKEINKEFAKYFKILFDGGKAELVLQKEDPDEKQTEEVVPTADQVVQPGILQQLADAEEKLSPKKFLKKRTGKVITGIDIVATPPGKKVMSITSLSGGERSLASIALICAVISNNPSPFVILDEVDAALDEANSQRYAKIIRELAHKTQFIVITHNRATMHEANILYGVTVGDDGVSRLISIKLEDAAKIVRQ